MHSGAISIEDAVKRARESGSKAVWVYTLQTKEIRFGCEYFVRIGEAPPDVPYFFDNGTFNGTLLHREIF